MQHWRFWTLLMAWNENALALSEENEGLPWQAEKRLPSYLRKSDGKSGKCDGVFSEKHCQKSLILGFKELRRG